MQVSEIVFDTNTWITFFYNAQFTELVDLKLEKKLIIYSCIRQQQELLSVLQRPKFKKKINLPVQEYISFYLDIATMIEVDEIFDRIPDLDDNYIIDLAYTIKADHIISSDRHLLSFKHIGKIQIISLTDFKRSIRAI